MNNSYWIKRAEELEADVYNDTLNFERGIMFIYETSIKNVEKEVSLFLNRYATEQGITYSEASKNLTRIEKSEYKQQMKTLTEKYKKTGSPELLERIKVLEARAIRTRLDALINSLEAEMAIMTEQVRMEMEGHLEGVYEKTYKETGNYLLMGLGLSAASAIHLAGYKTPNYVTKFPFSGMSFDGRLWKFFDKLKNTVKETVQKDLVQGKTSKEIYDNLHDKLTDKKGKYVSYDLDRIVQTESECVHGQGFIDLCIKYGIDKYSIKTARDERTCRNCGKRDGDTYLVSEAIIGETAPPFHPNCRCVRVIISDGVEIELTE